MKVGFVGLGIMGRPMANNLLKGGHSLFVYGNRTVPSEIRDGATVCDTLKAVAEHEGKKLGDVMQPVRVALTGGTVSEPVNELLAVVGREESLRRIAAAAGT